MSTILFTWLVQSALASTVILLGGSVAARLCRQPADGVRVAQWTLATTLAALVLACRPSMSIVSLGLVDAGGVAASAHAAGVDEASTPPRLSERAARALLVAAEDVAREIEESDDRPTRRVTAATAIERASGAAATSRELGEWAIGILGVLYLAGCGAMLLVWTAGLVKLHRLRRRARPAPTSVQRAFAQVAKSHADDVRLLVSDELAAPIMWGVRRPLIVLPRACCDDADSTRLRYCLAHEWAHVVRRDFATWQLATALQLALYYHPLFWRVRRQLAVSMDQLADAAAAGHGESATDYAEFLLELARRHLAPAPAASLGMSDKGSRLRERIVMLVESGLTLRAHCSRGRSRAIAAIAIVVAIAAAAVRVDAYQPETPEEPSAAAKTETPPDVEAQPAEPSGAPSKNADGSITYFGVVTDNVSGLPISGVKVSVIRRNSRDDWRIYETTEHQTNLLGVYSFTIPPEQAAESALYLEVEAHHPDYAAKGRGGYSHAMVLKNLEMGELPWFTKLSLWPGDAITGIVVSPEGEPLEGVEIRMYSAATKAEGLPRGSFDKTTTDEDGRFRIVPPTPGDGVLWIIPQDYSPVAYRLRDRRGDWGTLTMRRGVTIPGRVLDVDGEPVGGVKIEARRRGDGEEADEFLNSNAVANGIGREAIADANGSFTLASLPDGEYQLQVQADSESYDPPPLKQVFLRQPMTIADGAGPESLEIRAVPHVVISATYLDSKGKPRSGHEVTLFGRWDGGFYAERSSVPRGDGKLHVNAPHGLQQAELDLMTNEHSSLRWRMAPDEPLRRGRRVDLGTIEDDVSGIEIIRYVAPILLVKPVDDEGHIVADCQPVVTYTRPDGEGEEMSVYTTGGHVSFEHQLDGRWRSSQLLPDEPMKVTVKKEGYECEPQELSLAEGDQREVKVVLKKVNKTSADNPS